MAAVAEAAMIERTLPYSMEAEQSVLGSILLDPLSLVDVATTLKPDDFYRESHRHIYEAMLALREADTRVDLVTVTDQLVRQGRLEDAGGRHYLTSLLNAVPTWEHADHYAQIVERTSTMRRLVLAAGQIAALGYEEALEPEDALTRADELLTAIRRGGGATSYSMAEIVDGGAYDELYRLYHEPGYKAGISTGIPSVDRKVGGHFRGQYMVIGGATGGGKTSLALTMGYHAARAGHGVLIFALEMDQAEMYKKLIAMEGGPDTMRLRTGPTDLRHTCDPPTGDGSNPLYCPVCLEWDRVVSATGSLYPLPIRIADRACVSIPAIQAAVRADIRRHQIELVIIDYLQLVEGDPKTRNRAQELAEQSQAIKRMAKREGIGVIGLTQFNRGADSHPRPLLSDIRDSSGISAAADVVAFIWPEHPQETDPKLRNLFSMSVAKSRFGPTNEDIPLVFLREHGLFGAAAQPHSLATAGPAPLGQW